MKCRHCAAALNLCLLNLGESPPSNAYLSAEELYKPEKKFPLNVLVCTKCWLVQIEDFVGAEELFRPDYAYFSSTSISWLNHAKKYCDFVIPKFSLSSKDFVVEIASNDGYLLKNFIAAGIPCLGIEPTRSTATAAEKLGIPVKREFFTKNLSELLAKEKKADLIIANNVYAHVPDINDFTEGLRILLQEEGVVTLEFPHLLRLIKYCHFDTIYHEHFSYLSLITTKKIFESAGLKIFEAEELPTHGGSLRIYGCLKSSHRAVSPNIDKILKKEITAGLMKKTAYQGFQSRAKKIRKNLLKFLTACKKNGKQAVAYGAAAKGNTLLNYAGVNCDLLEYVCDASLAKQGKYLPGTKIPILSPSALIEDIPRNVLILSWNIADEVLQQYGHLKKRGFKFFIATPEIKRL